MAFSEGLGAVGIGEFIARSPAIPSVSILFVVASCIVYILSRPKSLNLPVMGKPGQTYYGNDIVEGASKVFILDLLLFLHAGFNTAFSIQILHSSSPSKTRLSSCQFQS